MGLLMMMLGKLATNQCVPVVHMHAGQSGQNYRVNQLFHTRLLMILTLCAESVPCQYCLTFILTDYVAFAERLSEYLRD